MNLTLFFILRTFIKTRFRRVILHNIGDPVSRKPHKWDLRATAHRLLNLSRDNNCRGAANGLSVMLLILLSITSGLQGCSWPASPPAPSPTLNPNPIATSHLEVSVQKGMGVNGVKVQSIWTVGDIGCAPTNKISGASITKQVVTDEKVEKVGSQYIATIVDDRFLPGKCKWRGGAYEVKFMHDNHVLSSTGAGPSEFDAARKLELTCTPPPDDPPTCFLRNKEVFLRSHFHGVFNATLERVK